MRFILKMICLKNINIILEINAELAEKWPNINRIKAAPADADQWAKVDDKLKYLEKEWPK